MSRETVIQREISIRKQVDSLIRSPGQSLINLLKENDRRKDERQSGKDKEPKIIL